MSASIYGGRLKDMPFPRRRLFPATRRRRIVTVSVQTFVGIGKHYYAKFREEDNPIWDREKKAWRTCPDDKKARGRSVTMQFNTARQARAYITRQLNLKRWRFHRVEFEYDSKRWFYRDGD